MKDKIKFLNKKMKDLDKRLFVTAKTEIKKTIKHITLRFEEDNSYWVLGKYYLEEDIYEKFEQGPAPDSYNELEKYFDNFKGLCKKLFKGYNEIEETIYVVHGYDYDGKLKDVLGFFQEKTEAENFVKQLKDYPYLTRIKEKTLNKT